VDGARDEIDAEQTEAVWIPLDSQPAAQIDGVGFGKVGEAQVNRGVERHIQRAVLGQRRHQLQGGAGPGDCWRAVGRLACGARGARHQDSGGRRAQPAATLLHQLSLYSRSCSRTT